MEFEIVDGVPEYSTASLHAGETEDVLSKRDVLLTGDKPEKQTQPMFTDDEVVDVPGQVVPFGAGTNSETEAKENIDHFITVPRGKLNSPDESNKLPEVKGFGLFRTSTDLNCEVMEQENPTKTFLWPPIGLKDHIIADQSATSQLDTFEQLVSHKDEENMENGFTIAEQVSKDKLSHHINQSEINISENENRNLTSILKKNDNGIKKTVHFPEKIVSVKFYDLSDDGDSDNDTLILSDPEDDDQEVPFNTYSDYTTHLLSSTSVGFIPNFTFPPVLKINDSQFYDDIDDDDEQILAIMDDDDGREVSDPNALVEDEFDSEEGTNGYKDNELTPTGMEKMPDHTSNRRENKDIEEKKQDIEEKKTDIEEKKQDIEEKTSMTSKTIDRTDYQNLQQASIEMNEVIENSEKIGKIIEAQLPVPKQGIELQDDFKIKFDGKEEYYETEVASGEVTKLSKRSSKEFEDQKVLEVNEVERLVGNLKERVHDDQMTSLEIQSQSKFQEMSMPMRENRDGHLEANFNENIDETLQQENDDLVGEENVSSAVKIVETPVTVDDSKNCVSYQQDTKIPSIDTLLDVLKARSSTSEVEDKESGCEAVEVRPFEDNLIEEEATCSHIFEGNTPQLTTLLPEIAIFDSRQLMDEKLNTAQKPGIIGLRPVGNETVLNSEEPRIYEQAFCDNHLNVIGANSVQLLIKSEKTPTNDASKLSTESVGQEVELTVKDKTKSPTEFVTFVTRKEEFAAKDDPVSILATGVDRLKESNENSDGRLDGSPLTSSSCTRTFHRNYGSKFLWRGPRSMRTLILDENIHVPAAPTTTNNVLQQSPLAKEEISLLNFKVINDKSLESMMPVSESKDSSGSKYCCHESLLEKYPHSFITSPDHVNEFEDTWESTIEPGHSIKRQKVEDCDYDARLKQNCLKSGIRECGKHSETAFAEQHSNMSHTTFERGDNPVYPEECATLHRQPNHVCFPAAQIVPDMYSLSPTKTQPTGDSPRAVPSEGDNLTMDTTNTSLHLTEYPHQSHKRIKHCETVKDESNVEGSSYSPTPVLARQGRRRLRVGLSKSTRVLPLHPYWSRERIKEKGSIS